MPGMKMVGIDESGRPRGDGTLALAQARVADPVALSDEVTVYGFCEACPPVRA